MPLDEFVAVIEPPCFRSEAESANSRPSKGNRFLNFKERRFLQRDLESLTHVERETTSGKRRGTISKWRDCRISRAARAASRMKEADAGILRMPSWGLATTSH
jgi:hypothetical protein